MSLEKTLKEIQSIKPYAEEDTTQGPVETLNARRGRQAAAIEKMKLLTRSYSEEMMRTSIFIVATGSTRASFAKVAEENFGMLVANADDFYKDLASRVVPSLYLNKDGVSNVFDVLGRHLEDKMMELNVMEYNQLLFKSEYSRKINSAEEFTAMVKSAVNKQIGAEIAGVQAVRSLVNTAIERNHSADTTPIVLDVDDEEFAVTLSKDLKRLSPRVFVVASGETSGALKSLTGVMNANITEDEEANKTSVKKVLTAMRKKIKTK